MKNQQKRHSSKRVELLKIYSNLVVGGKLFPSRQDLKEVGLDRDTVRYYFGNMSKIRNEAKEMFPDSFKGTVDLDEYLSDKNLYKLERKIKKFSKFIITTAVSGQALEKNFYDSLKLYCKINKAKLLILPSHDPAHNLDNEIEWTFDPELTKKEDIVFEETRLNSNIFISEIRVTAKQINPVTGLSEISQNKGSFVFASPKQSLEFDAVSANKLPHARMSTGACTLPNYKTTRGTSLRTGYLATFQHVIGAIVVEIEDNEIYHFRQIQAAKDGSFCDLGIEYSKNGTKRSIPRLIMGDYHAGEHDETAISAWIEMINEMKIEEVVFHDMFNGISVNPHEEEDVVSRSELIKSGLNSLETELKITANEFDRILGLKSVKSGIVVKSNHDDFINRWLKKGKFVYDPVNFQIGCKLAAVVVGTDKDFFSEGLKLVGEPKYMKKLKFLSVDEDYIIGGVNLGAHGDRGANGSRGGLRNLSKSYSKCFVGHSHTPGIYRGAFQVGTSSKRRLNYNKGPSSWMHCSGLQYDNGQRQLINSIGGKWRKK